VRIVGAIFAAMKAKPNLTVIEGVVRAIRPDAGGYGSNVDIEVSRNVSPEDGGDFLKPKPAAWSPVNFLGFIFGLGWCR
jgi:hypothetical protein